MLGTRAPQCIKAAVDIDPEKLGKSMSELTGVPAINATVSDNLIDAIDTHKPTLAIVATSSYAKTLRQQIEPMLQRGVNVLSTCEELSYPWPLHAEHADAIDALAKQHQVTVLASGVNPGYLMDFLPTVATGLCESVSSIRVERIQDASHRRIPFQKKIGVGLNPIEYQELVASGQLRHMGLKESAYLIAAKLGWQVDSVTETIEPVVQDGQVMGTRQISIASNDNTPLIELIFHAQMHATEPKDVITVVGSPGFSLRFDPPVQGDKATASIIVNAIPGVLNASPGLKTMADMNGLSFWSKL